MSVLMYPQLACFLVTALLHLFFMASFSWMLVEGLLLWSKVVSVNISEDHRMKLYYAIGWGNVSDCEKLSQRRGAGMFPSRRDRAETKQQPSASLSVSHTRCCCGPSLSPWCVLLFRTSCSHCCCNIGCISGQIQSRRSLLAECED